MSATDKSDMDGLIKLMAKLRDPDSGCPWDLRQDFHTIAPYTIEEAYEVADAIEQGDMNRLKDELGDLLFQVVFHARMAQEQQSFCLADVIEAIVSKMIRRHPHVFPGARDAQPVDLEASWEAIKSAERAAAGEASDSRMDGVPVGLPGLLRAGKLQKKAARAGFDWTDTAPVLAKLQEEIGELQEAMARDDVGARAAMASELGDVLFTVVNLARHLRLDPETCLAGTNSRFERRFRAMEALQGKQPGDMSALSADELESLWQAAKAREGKTHSSPGS